MASTQEARTQRGGLKSYQTFMHPEVHKRLKIAAIEDDQTIPEKLHAILCHEFGLEHLLLQAPDGMPA